MDKETLAKLRRRALRDIKLNTFLVGWCACAAFTCLMSLLTDGNLWMLFGFAMNASFATYSWKKIFGENDKKVMVKFYDTDTGKEIE